MTADTQQQTDTEEDEEYSASERLCSLWPSLYTDVQRQIVDSDQDDPGWMQELSEQEQQELRREAKKELEMMEKDVERRKKRREKRRSAFRCHSR